MKILLLGPPACGKGTIGKILSEKLNLPLINVGKMFREVPPDSIWYNPIQEAMKEGKLAPHSILGSLLSELTLKPPYKKGYILDGGARHMLDLDYFDPKPDIVLHLNISEETSKKRTLSRKICQQAGHTYNLLYNPPKKSGVCDIDGSQLISREDDNLEVLKRRWEIFRHNTLEVLDHYRRLGKLHEISAEGSPPEIYTKIKTALNI